MLWRIQYHILLGDARAFWLAGKWSFGSKMVRASWALRKVADLLLELHTRPHISLNPRCHGPVFLLVDAFVWPESFPLRNTSQIWTQLLWPQPSPTSQVSGALSSRHLRPHARWCETSRAPKHVRTPECGREVLAGFNCWFNSSLTHGFRTYLQCCGHDLCTSLQNDLQKIQKVVVV